MLVWIAISTLHLARNWWDFQLGTFLWVEVMRMAVVSGVTTAAKMVAVVVVGGRKKGGDSGSLSGVGWCRSVEDDDGVEMVDLGLGNVGLVTGGGGGAEKVFIDVCVGLI
nr:hypothetical protein [Tanacetum cinerariifolium]